MKKNILFSIIVTITISFTQYGNEGSRTHCTSEIFCDENSSDYDSFICDEICYAISGKIIHSCSEDQIQYYKSISSSDANILDSCFSQYITTGNIPITCSIYHQENMSNDIDYSILFDTLWLENDNDEIWDPHENYESGWGVFLKNDSPENTNLAIHVNHPLADEYTDFIGGFLFEDLSPGYLLIAGAHRYSLVDTSSMPICSTGDTCQTNYGADTARREDECNNNDYTTSFQLFHESLSTNIDNLVSVSIHGFINDLLNIDNPPVFILSNGNDGNNYCIPPDLFTSTIYHKLIDEFSGDSLFADSCGSEIVAIIVQQEINCIDYPTTCGDELTSPYSDYAAYSNPQGRYTNNTDTININTEDDIWIHIEMDECIRDNYNLYSRTAEVVAQAITECNIGTCEGCDAGNPCSSPMGNGVDYGIYEYNCCTAQLGDLNGDEDWNVLDIVTLVNCVLAQNCAGLANGCAGDLNGDEDWNVLDVVTLANCVLAQNCSEI